MAEINDLILDILPLVGEAPDELVVAGYRWAARRLCTKARPWREDMVLADGADPSRYTISNVPADTEAFDLEELRYLTMPLTPGTYRQTQNIDGFSDTAAQPIKYQIDGVNALRVYPKPPASVLAGLDGRMILRPTRTAATFDDTLADRYSDALEYGTLYFIYRVPDESFSDAKEALVQLGLFNEAVAEAETTAADGGMKIPRKTKYGGLSRLRPVILRPGYGTTR